MRQAAAVARNMPGQSSLTAQDLARGKRTEIDYLNGYVVRMGASLAGYPLSTSKADISQTDEHVGLGSEAN